MAFTYGTEMQDRVAYTVLNTAYASLPAYQKAILDNTTTTPTGGAALSVLNRIQNLCQWLSMGAITVMPDLVSQLFHAEMCYEVAKALRFDLVKGFREGRNDAWDQFVDGFQRNETTSYSTEFSSLTLQTVRYHTINWLVRRKPAIFVPIEDIDAATQYIINWVWRKARWSFRREQVSMAIATDGTVVFTPSTGFEEFTTRMLYHSPDLVGGGILWADADLMARAKASAADSSTPTGTPRLFRFQKAATTAGTITWHWYPTPDAAYTVYAEIITSGPGIPGSATETTVFDKFPAEFKQVIKDLVRAKVVRDQGIAEGAVLWQDAVDAVDSMLPDFDEPGDVVRPSTVKDVYGDVEAQTWGSMMGGSL